MGYFMVAILVGIVSCCGRNLAKVIGRDKWNSSSMILEYSTGTVLVSILYNAKEREGREEECHTRPEDATQDQEVK